MNFNQVHRRVGLAVIGAFLATGVYMKLGFPGLGPPGDLVRSLFRANHVYLLASGLLNLVVGIYLRPAHTPGRGRCQRAGSILLLAAPVVLLFAFVFDPPRGSFHRPATTLGMLALFAATVLLAIGGAGRPAGGRA